MGEPTLDEFRRWLQAEIAEIDALETVHDSTKRMIQLETALQEAMAFTAAWAMRLESDITPVIRKKSVRLLSSAPDESSQKESTESCSECEAEIVEDLQFCPVCGANR